MFIVYKTTNLTNNHYYIGVHKQDGISFDGYYGSGVGLKRAIQKYGKQNFNRETLYVFDDVEEAYIKEKELLIPVYRLDECYNMHPGGRGIRGNICFHSEEWRKKVSDAHKGKKLSAEHIEKIKKYDRTYMKTDEYRFKMSEAKKGKENIKRRGINNQPNTINVKTPLGSFKSLREAAKAHNISAPTIKSWAEKQINGFEFFQ
jgi:hypothetical protein